MTAHSRRGPSTGPGSHRPGSTRPREAPRPEGLSSSSPGTPELHLCPATFVDLSADQERLAIGALAELLVPLLADPEQPSGALVVGVHEAPVGDT